MSNQKIAIVVSSLGRGGAERSSANLSHMLSNLGYEVHIISILNKIYYDYSGKLLNLGLLKDKKDNPLSRLKRLQVFKTYIQKHNFKTIIDNRSRVQAYREFVLSKFVYNCPVIYVVHNHKTERVFTKYKFLNHYLYKNSIVVGVSKAISEKIKIDYKLNNVQTIYNSFPIEEINKQADEEFLEEDICNDYIIYFGRLYNEQKNLKLLFDAYKASKAITNKINLVVLGDGEDYQECVDYVNSLGISSSVIFKPFVTNPFVYVKRAKFTLLSSHYEGFPMVIPESLAVGTPVVSVDCKSGPNEIIQHKKNGLLVKNYSVNALAEAINTFLFDEQLYKVCKCNAKQSVEPFSINAISEKWKYLLDNM